MREVTVHCITIADRFHLTVLCVNAVAESLYYITPKIFFFSSRRRHTREAIDWSSDVFFFSSRRRHTRLQGDWSSDVCSSDLERSDLDVIGADAVPSRTQLGDALDFQDVAADAGDPPPHRVQGVTEPLDEIGRASCRERV